MAYCEECGHELSPVSRYCENCGAEVQNASLSKDSGVCAVSIIRDGRAVAFLSKYGTTKFIKEFPPDYHVTSARIEGDKVVVEADRKNRRHLVLFLNKATGSIITRREF